MEKLNYLLDRIVDRVNANLRAYEYDIEPYIRSIANLEKMLKFSATYGVTSQHPLSLNFKNSNISGSYFLGKCSVKRSVVYKSEIRGDELKRKGDIISDSYKVPLAQDEKIKIKGSFLFKTLVHSNSHNPETPEEFYIRNTVSTHYSNIHGSTVAGCYIGPYATVDLMSLHSCIVGEYSYLQADELFHRSINPGTILVENDSFSFIYKYNPDVLKKYVYIDDSSVPKGVLVDFVEDRKNEFERLYAQVDLEPFKAPESSSISRFCLIKGKTRIGENVMACQRSYLENAIMGEGSNAQENCYIINSHLKGFNVTAHGGKIINSDLEPNVFVGFNSFLNGKKDSRISIGEDCIVMPHTIIDSDEAIKVPANHIVWGFIGSQKDVEINSISADNLMATKEATSEGMEFKGDGDVFVNAFKGRIKHILELNGAFAKDGENEGHAQSKQNASLNTLQPYRTGPNKGVYPTIRIAP
ncbi:MAG: transferase [Deltaproteobacteria bacterium]|nr:transferase [Deltaproteobacteria bacterium]